MRIYLHPPSNYEEIALVNIYEAKAFLDGDGEVAILDATNVSSARRHKIRCHLDGHPIFFVECVNEDQELVAAGIQRKSRSDEFAHLTREQAFRSLEKRIEHYRRCYDPFVDEENFITIDSLTNTIIKERVNAVIPFYPRVRDILVSDWINCLFLVRHGQTFYNLEYRIGGDSGLTEKGFAQANALARHFADVRIPFVFTSTKLRTQQMAEPLLASRTDSTRIVLPELDEIDAGICENMTYEEIQSTLPNVHQARTRDKYHYIYPQGEGYATLRERVDRGIKKALYLSGNAGCIMIVGHQAVNRMILSHFLFRRTEDVPYIYIPQNKYFHIVSTQSKKLFELIPFNGKVVDQS